MEIESPALNRLEVSIKQQYPVFLDVSFGVNGSELVALVGPSGGGKSTILRIIAGFEKPDSGIIKIGDETWLDSENKLSVPTRRRRLGMVFQSYALFPHLSAVDNVMQAISHGSETEKKETANKYLARLNLKGLGERRPDQLSGGQRQRVAVARALAREPQVLLMDEPFSAVDRVTRIRLQRELVELRAQLSIPIIFVTHDMEEAARLADRVAVLHEGRILQTDAYEVLSSRPVNTTVAKLLGIRNIFNATIAVISRSEEFIHLQWGKHQLIAPYYDGFDIGQSVTWCVASDGIVVHRRNRPSRGEHENPVSGNVRDLFRFGQNTELVIDANDPDALPIHCSIPTHVASRNDIASGVDITVSIKTDMIHIMAPT